MLLSSLSEWISSDTLKWKLVINTKQHQKATFLHADEISHCAISNQIKTKGNIFTWDMAVIRDMINSRSVVYFYKIIGMLLTGKFTFIYNTECYCILYGIFSIEMRLYVIIWNPKLIPDRTSMPTRASEVFIENAYMYRYISNL